MIKDHSRFSMTESQILAQTRTLQPFQVISGIQTYIDYLHQNLCFFPPTGRINFGQGDIAGLTQCVNNYATMLKIPQTSSYTIQYLIVAGGGGAGGHSNNGISGGGGAGGLLTSSISSRSGITFVATIGSGGIFGGSSGSLDLTGSNGGNSSLVYGSTSIIASGGGGGASYDIGAGLDGGSGGGGSGGAGSTGTGGNGISGQGFKGGVGSLSSDAGGGGGAGGLGGDAYYDALHDTNYSGNGGNGLQISITGTPTWYATGGAGAGGNNDGTNPTGYGGYGSGGSFPDPTKAGNGYSGIVILSVPTSKYTGTITGSPSVTTSGSNTIISWTGTSGTYIS